MRCKLFSLLLALCLVFSLMLPALAAEAPSVQLDGQATALTPKLMDRRAYLPYSELFAALGAEASLDGNEVIATRAGRTVRLPLEPGGAYTSGDFVYVPVRAAAEGLGCNVGWDRDSRTVLIVDVVKLVQTAVAKPEYQMIAALETTGAPLHAGEPVLTGADELLQACATRYAPDAARQMDGRLSGGGALSQLLSCLPLTDGQSAYPMAQALVAGLSDSHFQQAGNARLARGVVGDALSYSVVLRGCDYRLRLSMEQVLTDWVAAEHISALGLEGERAQLTLLLEKRDDSVTGMARADAGRLSLKTALTAQPRHT